MLGRFATATPEQVGRAVAAAKAAQRDWARRPWRDRLAILRRAASLIRERKFELAAIMALEVGKSRLESMGDAEESADLIDYYGQELEDARSEEHTSELQSRLHLVCRLLLEKKKNKPKSSAAARDQIACTA